MCLVYNMSLIKALKNAESQLLSDLDLKHIMRNEDILVVAYHDLENVNNLEELFNGHNAFILTLESEYNSGHYVSVVYNPNPMVNELSFNDSYGYTHDKLIKKGLDYYTHKNTGEYFFNNLVLDFKQRYGCTYVQNTVKYQYESEKINTCGRWAAFRILLYFMPMNEYNKAISDLMKHLRLVPDDFITLLTFTSIF